MNPWIFPPIIGLLLGVGSWSLLLWQRGRILAARASAASGLAAEAPSVKA